MDGAWYERMEEYMERWKDGGKESYVGTLVPSPTPLQRANPITSIAMAVIKKKKKPQKLTSVDEDVEKSEPFYTVGGNLAWYSHCGKQYGGPQE